MIVPLRFRSFTAARSVYNDDGSFSVGAELCPGFGNAERWDCSRTGFRAV